MLKKIAPEPIAEMHSLTAKEYDISEGDEMIVETVDKKLIIKAGFTEDVMPGVIGLVHGCGNNQNANLLTTLELNDPVTGYPALMRNIACRIKKAKVTTPGAILLQKSATLFFQIPFFLYS